MPTFDYPSNLTDINQTINYVSSVTNDMFGLSMLLIIFSISFFALKTRFPTNEAMASSMFTVTLSSIMFWLLGVLPAETPPILAMMTAFSVVLMFRGGGE